MTLSRTSAELMPPDDITPSYEKTPGKTHTDPPIGAARAAPAITS
jgi:hypothetical protein